MDNRQFIPPPPINTQCSKCSDRVCRLRFVESSTIPHERVLLSKSSIATTMLPSILLLTEVKRRLFGKATFGVVILLLISSEL